MAAIDWSAIDTGDAPASGGSIDWKAVNNAALSVKPTPAPEAKQEYGSGVSQQALNLLGGLARGAGSIGATLLAPVDAAANALGIHNAYIGRSDRRTAMDAALGDAGVDSDSLAYKVGKLGAEVAGTAGAGGVLANGAKAILPAAIEATPIAQKVIQGLSSGGFKLGGAAATTLPQMAGNVALRAGTGAAVGGASAGMVDPSQALSGASIGGAFPVAAQAVGAAAGAVGRSIAGSGVSPEVAALAQKAKQYGIEIPSDRLANSKVLNSVASGLNYVPFSGRQAVEDGMQSQLNSALTKTFGQTGDNVTTALNQAKNDLGGQFDGFLKSNSVNVDHQFMTDLGDVSAQASKNLVPDQAKIISNYIDDIVGKVNNGQIDGQAAYNIKRDLDSLAKSGSPVATSAKELRNTLMGALNRSITPAQQDAFATLRKQYGNMKALMPLMQNGAEGNVSLARLSNLKNVNNSDLQDLADISAQFLKPREGIHSAKQSALFGAMGLLNAGGGVGSMIAGPVGGAIGGAGALAGGTALGRMANSALGSNWARNAVLNSSMPLTGLLSDSAAASAPLLYRSAGLLNAQ